MKVQFDTYTEFLDLFMTDSNAYAVTGGPDFFAISTDKSLPELKDVLKAEKSMLDKDDPIYSLVDYLLKTKPDDNNAGISNTSNLYDYTYVWEDLHVIF